MRGGSQVYPLSSISLIMGIFKNLDVSASGMTANRSWMDLLSSNIANANTTRTPAGGPYRNQIMTFASVLDKARPLSPLRPPVGIGVQAAPTLDNKSPFITIYNPSHPDADAKGYVSMPNVNLTTDMVNMIAATRSYEANVGAFNSGKSMYMKALEVGK